MLPVAADAVLDRPCLRIVPVETLAQSTAMDANNPITAAIFSAFLKCPTKAHLMAIGEPAPDYLFRRHRGAHIVYVQSGGEAAAHASGPR